MRQIIEALQNPMIVTDEAKRLADAIFTAPIVPPPLWQRDQLAAVLQYVSTIASEIKAAAPQQSLVHDLCDKLMLPDPVIARAHDIFAKHSVGNSRQEDNHPVMKMIIEALREGMGK